MATYIRIFQGAETFPARGEASVTYIASPESASWIKDTLGDVKIIAILRDPAERAWSLYKWMIMEGVEDAKTFEDALVLEPLRLAHEERRFKPAVQQFFPDYLYFQTGLYAAQISRYLKVFGKERVKIFLFEDFIRAQLSVCRDIFQFLNVDPEFVPRLGQHNVSVIPCSIPLQCWLANYRGPLRLPPKLARKLMSLNLKLGGPGDKPLATLNRLRAMYTDDLKQLEGIIDRDLSSWYQQK